MSRPAPLPGSLDRGADPDSGAGPSHTGIVASPGAAAGAAQPAPGAGKPANNCRMKRGVFVVAATDRPAAARAARAPAQGQPRGHASARGPASPPRSDGRRPPPRSPAGPGGPPRTEPPTDDAEEAPTDDLQGDDERHAAAVHRPAGRRGRPGSGGQQGQEEAAPVGHRARRPDHGEPAATAPERPLRRPVDRRPDAPGAASRFGARSAGASIRTRCRATEA